MNLKIVGLALFICVTVMGCDVGSQSDGEFLPICTGLAGDFPQTPKQVQEQYGIDSYRVQMLDAYRCRIERVIDRPTVEYYAFLVRDGVPVTAKIPDGGSIEEIAENDYGKYFITGYVTARSMIVSGVLLIN